MRGWGARGLTVIGVVSLVLAGCGQPEPDGTARMGGEATATRVGGTANPPPATTAPATPAPEPTSITVAAAGDLLVHVPVRKNAAAFAKHSGKGQYDFRPMFAKVGPILSKADLAICHMETPLSRDNKGLSQPGVLVFNTPHELIDAVKDAGYDGCDFASNHTWDGGLDGLRRTADIIKGAGLQYAGPYADKEAPESVAWYAAKGLKVAQLAYSYTILNNWGPNVDTPSDAPYLKAAMWPATKAAGIIADAKRARSEGADIVIVSLHWGQEYVTKPTADQTELATELLNSPEVDLILGTHVHVVQPCSTINGKFVFYGMGNSLSNQGPSQSADLRPETQEGIMPTVTFTKGSDGRITQQATYQPTRVDLDRHIIVPVTKASHPTSWNRTTHWVGLLDNCSATPTGG